ncbi:MAG: hypothetical protein R3A43_03085 [Bacteroidia bacterium]
MAWLSKFAKISTLSLWIFLNSCLPIHSEVNDDDLSIEVEKSFADKTCYAESINLTHSDLLNLEGVQWVNRKFNENTFTLSSDNPNSKDYLTVKIANLFKNSLMEYPAKISGSVNRESSEKFTFLRRNNILIDTRTDTIKVYICDQTISASLDGYVYQTTFGSSFTIP